MKIKFLISLVLIPLFFSCGSGKKYVRTKRVPRVVIEPKHENPKMVQLEQNETSRGVVTPRNTSEYIYKFAPIAIEEMKLYKIPASITLAQGILESGSGRSDLAIRSNNHFGIKCHKGWQGKSVTHDDDEIGECFRKYKYPESSYEDHSKFLTSRKRYAKLFKLKPTDYKGWAYGLKRAGYATDPRYPQKLITLIKKYDLHKYDLMKEAPQGRAVIRKEPVNSKPKPVYKPKVFSSKYTVVKGDTLYSIARRYKISVSELKRKNRLRSNSLRIGQKLIVR